MAFDPDKIEDLQHSTEKQIMDRKAARIAARDFAIPVVAFANADGGYLAVGIEDDGTITGIDDYEKNLNELLRVPFDFCVPSVDVENVYMDVTDCNGNPNHILRMHVLQSGQVIANQADDVFLRVGDKSKKLNFEQRLQLVYAKGVKYFEDQPVSDATIDDIDLDFVKEYCEKIEYTKGDAEYYLRHNKDFIRTVNGKDVISGAAILLFGNNPQRYFPRARVRFIRYDGTQAQVGENMNVIKDVRFEGRIIEQLTDIIDFVKTQIKDYTKLGKGAQFQTTHEYPKFCWTELIVNAVGHRDYSIKGTDIQIKMFDDHFVVESPGILPGTVRISNIRENHFSRNPKIMELLIEYKFVREYGEGVDRVFNDMKAAGLPDPEYRQTDFMLTATLKNREYGQISLTEERKSHDGGHDRGHDRGHDGGHDEHNIDLDEKFEMIIDYCEIPRTRQEIMDYMRLSSRGQFKDRYLKPLLESGRLEMTIPDKPQSKNQKYIKNTD